MDTTDKPRRGRPPGRTQTALIRVYATPGQLADLDAERGTRSRSDVAREALARWIARARRRRSIGADD